MPYRAAHSVSASTCSGEGGPDGCGRASPTAGRASSRTNRENVSDACASQRAGSGELTRYACGTPRGATTIRPASDDEAVTVDEELERTLEDVEDLVLLVVDVERDHVAGMPGDLGQRPVRPFGVDADGVVEEPQGLGGLGERGLHDDLLGR